MKAKLLTIALMLTLGASTAMAKEFVLTDIDKGISVGNWQVSNKDIDAKGKTSFSVTNTVLKGGKQEGSEVITITSGDFTIKLSPTRGMGILSVVGNGIRMGWDSPVQEVVNPAFMNLESRGGNGWLEGFTEMMVRCGFEWTGHAVEADGMMYSLHGKAANTPVSKLIVDIEDKAPYKITVKGLIQEKAFKKVNLETWATLSYTPGDSSFVVHDTLTNKNDYPRDYQILYHSNYGQPILEEGAKFVAPVKEISPFNDYAIDGMKTWDTYLGPTKNFDEMVLNVVPYANDKGQTQVMVTNKDGSMGAGIAFNTSELPFLSLWKNTDTLKQGYVTGMEPGTSFAYPVTIARELGHVRQLQAGQSTEFTLTYSLLANKAAVDKYADEIKAIQGDRETAVLTVPMAKE